MWLSALLLATALGTASAPAATAPEAARTLPATPQFRHYDVSQGLPASNVYKTVQDADGILWIGTRSGLARFDGNAFKVFHHVPGDPASLAANDVSGLVIDSRGRLWAGGEASGLNLLDPATGTFTHYRHDKNDPASLASNDVLTIVDGGDGTLWVGTWSGGLDHMVSPGHFEHLRHNPDDPDSLAGNSVMSLAVLPDGRVLVGTLRGLDILETDGHLHHVPFEGHDKPPRIWTIDHDRHDIRIGTSAGLFVLGKDDVARRFAPGTIPADNVMSSVRDLHGDLWVGTRDGLYLVEPDGRTTHFPPAPLLPGGQPGTLVWQVSLDNEGGLWITTQNAGIAYLSPDWRDFTHYSHRPDDTSSLSGNRILSLSAAADGRLWVGGTNGQLDRLDPRTGDVTHYENLPTVGTNSVLALASFGHDRLWIGHHGGLTLREGDRERQVTSPLSSLDANMLVVDRQGNAYASPPGQGMFRIAPDTLQVTPLKPAFPDSADRESSGLLMHDGTPWLSTRAGLSRLAADGRRFEPVDGVARGIVNSFGFDGPQNLWVARPHALEHYRLDAAGHATLAQRIDAAHGWPGIETNALTVDSHGRIWMFATVGLWRYDPASGDFHEYSKSDGLPSIEFTSRQLVQRADGVIFTGSLGGVVAFSPDAMKKHPRAPDLHVTSASVQREGKTLLLPLAGRGLDLHWNDRDLRITAHAVSYIDPSRNRYRFRLKGLDADWVDTGSHGVREFAGLGAGNYRLEVQAAGPSGVWGQLQTPLAIHVDAPPWARPWAWLLYAAALLLLVWTIVTIWRRRLEQRHHLQMIEQEREMARQASNAKTRFLATLSHEIRTPMTGLLGMAELLLNGHLDAAGRRCARTIQRSGQLMLKLVNDSLDMARIEAGRFELEPAPMDPRALLDDVHDLQAQQARHKGLEWHVVVDPGMPAALVGDRHRIQQILLNLTNNAFKFTGEGAVTVHAGYADGQLHLRVSDTGPGISEADRERLFHRFEQADSPQRREGAGLGLAICRELVHLMRGRIELASTPGEGSHFDIDLPLPEVPASAMADADDGNMPVAAGFPGGFNLLLVEDDPTVADTLRGLLEQAGHHVTHAAQGLAALGALETGVFDAVLMDMNLPGMDGCQLVRLIREREAEGMRLPIVAITARSGTDEERQAREAGMDAFLRKPVDLGRLTRVLLDLTAAGPRPPSPDTPREIVDKVP